MLLLDAITATVDFTAISTVYATADFTVTINATVDAFIVTVDSVTAIKFYLSHTLLLTSANHV